MVIKKEEKCSLESNGMYGFKKTLNPACFIGLFSFFWWAEVVCLQHEAAKRFWTGTAHYVKQSHCHFNFHQNYHIETWYWWCYLYPLKLLAKEEKHGWDCNVVDMTIAQHIQKGNEDGLFISNMACCSDLWTLILDAGSGFTSQVNKLSPNFFFSRSLITPKKFSSLIIGLCNHS